MLDGTRNPVLAIILMTYVTLSAAWTIGTKTVFTTANVDTEEQISGFN